MTIPHNLGVYLSTGMLANTDVLKLIGVQKELVGKFLENRFDPTICSNILEATLDCVPEMKKYFNVESMRRGGCVASNYLLYEAHQDQNVWALSFFKEGMTPIALSLPGQSISEVTKGLREGLQGRGWEQLSQTLAEPKILGMAPSISPAPEWPTFTGPGIQRLEHASLIIASENTKILLDPIGLAAAGPFGFPCLDQMTSNMNHSFDAIMLTHGHLDHWHLPTILRYGREGSVPVIVPQIPFASLLALDDFAKCLQGVGQSVIESAWGETVMIGDIEIDVLPFYGEQPFVSGPKPPDGVRNWGNCYRINTPQFSAIVLADSGDDAMGRTKDSIAASVARRGPPDIILSCCREMNKAPFWQGLFTYWMVLPFEELHKVVISREKEEGVSITLGPEGIADVCKQSDAKLFAPYAHGFRGMGNTIDDIAWGSGESAESVMTARIERSLCAKGATTKVVNWLPGDIIRIASGVRVAPS